MLPLQLFSMLTAFTHYNHLARLHTISLEQQLQARGSSMAPAVTRSSFDEWNINSCSGGCKRGSSESVCVVLYICSRSFSDGECGRITDDILIGLRCQMPAAEANRASPGCNSVSVARQGFRRDFRSLLALPRAPTGIRCSSVVPSSHTHTFLLLSLPFLWSALRHCQHQSIWGKFSGRKARGWNRPGLLCVESFHAEAQSSGFSATSCSVWITTPPPPTSNYLI